VKHIPVVVSGKSSVTFPQAFISGSDVEPGVLFRPWTCYRRMRCCSELNCNERTATSAQIVCFCTVVVHFRSGLQDCIACQADQFRYAVFKKW